MTPVQLFVCDSEAQLEIEFTIKKPIKTQCKTPHPQPLSQSTGRGEQDQKMWVKIRYPAHEIWLYSKLLASSASSDRSPFSSAT